MLSHTKRIPATNPSPFFPMFFFMGCPKFHPRSRPHRLFPPEKTKENNIETQSFPKTLEEKWWICGSGWYAPMFFSPQELVFFRKRHTSPQTSMSKRRIWTSALLNLTGNDLSFSLFWSLEDLPFHVEKERINLWNLWPYIYSLWPNSTAKMWGKNKHISDKRCFLSCVMDTYTIRFNMAMAAAFWAIWARTGTSADALCVQKKKTQNSSMVKATQ